MTQPPDDLCHQWRTAFMVSTDLSDVPWTLRSRLEALCHDEVTSPNFLKRMAALIYRITGDPADLMVHSNNARYKPTGEDLPSKVGGSFVR